MGELALAITKRTTTTPLSSAHEALAMVERQFDAAWLNQLANDPDIFPWVHGAVVGPMDCAPIAADPRNLILAGEHGAIVMKPVAPGIYDVHTTVLKTGRGKWAVAFSQACAHWAFTKSDAVELGTRVPRGNIAALALTKLAGASLEGEVADAWIMDHQPIPAKIFSLGIIAWVRQAPGLYERGQWFMHRMMAEVARHGREASYQSPGQIYERQIGAACEAVFGGQPIKGLTIFNRWAAICGTPLITVLAMRPLTVDTGGSILIFRNDDFWVASCR